MPNFHHLLKLGSPACPVFGAKSKHSAADLEDLEGSGEDAAGEPRSACCTAGRPPGCPSVFPFPSRLKAAPLSAFYASELLPSLRF